MRLWLAGLAAVMLVMARPAAAHAFGARYDLPLPLGLYLAAAGAAVAASFLGGMMFMGAAGRRSLTLEIEFPLWAGRAVSTLLGVGGLLVLGVLLGAAFSGPQEAVRNLATVGIWVIWWVGFLLFSALVISLWPQVDPFQKVSRLAARAVGRPWTEGAPEMPAVAGLLAPIGLLAIAWLELISDWSESPQALGLLVALYLLVSIAGGLAFGQHWFRIADPLNRILAALGRVAPLAIADRTTLRLRPPGEGLLERHAQPFGEVALVCGLIGIVLFDGLSETPAWAAVLDFVSESRTLRPPLLWLRDQGADLMKVIRTLGLFATVLAFYTAYQLLVVVMQALVKSGLGREELARHFVGTLLPIAVAYHLSHYVSYLLLAGQLILPAASDPFGRGWDLFGTADRSIDIGVIGAEQVWWIAFMALIAGHALSVLVAHRRAVVLFLDPRRAALSQFPMTLAMIGLTVLSLWILSQPITE